MNNKLKELRQKKGLTQENIAYELGISQKAYSKIENNLVCLSNEKMMKIAEILKVSPNMLCSLNCECSKNNYKLKLLLEYIENKGFDIPNFLK